MVQDQIARAVYMYFRLMDGAAVEHYWASLFTLPWFKNRVFSGQGPKDSGLVLFPCIMSWEHGRTEGRWQGISNKFLNAKALSALSVADWMEVCDGPIFARKFDSKTDKSVRCV
jgi:hypothetical protein